MEDKILSAINDLKQLTLIMSKPYLTIREAAMYLGTTENAVRKRLGQIRYYKPGKMIYIAKTDLDKWITDAVIPSDQEVARKAAILLDNK